MTEKEQYEMALHLKQGGKIEYGGMILKAKNVIPQEGKNLCEICPIESRCSLPFSLICALMEIDEPYNWILVKEDDL